MFQFCYRYAIQYIKTVDERLWPQMDRIGMDFNFNFFASSCIFRLQNALEQIMSYSLKNSVDFSHSVP